MFLQTGLSKYTYFFDENLVCNKDFTIKHMHFNTNLRSKNLKNELLAEEIAVKHNVFTLFSWFSIGFYRVFLVPENTSASQAGVFCLCFLLFSSRKRGFSVIAWYIHGLWMFPPVVSFHRETQWIYHIFSEAGRPKCGARGGSCPQARHQTSKKIWLLPAFCQFFFDRPCFTGWRRSSEIVKMWKNLRVFRESGFKMLKNPIVLIFSDEPEKPPRAEPSARFKPAEPPHRNNYK